MNEIQKDILKDKIKLDYIYAKANTISKKKRLEDELFMFSDMCHEKFLLEDHFSWEYDQSFGLIDNKEKDIFTKNVLDKKDIYEKISDSVIDTYIDANYPFYKRDIDIYTKYHNLKKGQMKDIILSFLSTFNNDLYKLYKDSIKEGLLFKERGGVEESYGVTYGFSSLKKNYMFASTNLNGEDTLMVAATIMHEFGHHYEMGLYHKSGIQNKMWLYPFMEITSQFFEYAFINYLKDNKIYLEDVNLYQRLSFYELFYFMFGINILSEIKKVGPNEYTYDIDEMREKEEKLNKKINYYQIEGFDMDEFTKCYTYGLGYLCSPYLYKMYKQDPRVFMKEFQNALLTYQYTNDINTFETVGVTTDKLIEGKVLRKVLGSIK